MWTPTTPTGRGPQDPGRGPQNPGQRRSRSSAVMHVTPELKVLGSNPGGGRTQCPRRWGVGDPASRKGAEGQVGITDTLQFRDRPSNFPYLTQNPGRGPRSHQALRVEASSPPQPPDGGAGSCYRLRTTAPQTTTTPSSLSCTALTSGIMTITGREHHQHHPRGGGGG